MKKVMVITGGGSGLGEALAHKAAADYRIAILDQNLQAAEHVVDALQQAGHEAVCFQCDVADASQVQACSQQIMTQYGQVNVLVNNAGVASQGGVEKSSLEQWQRVLAINVMGVVHGCQAFIPHLKQQTDAAIINIASFAAIALAPYMASYNVSKAGVLALSETLRGELADSGIHVGVACPAFFKTALTDSMIDSDEVIKERIKKWMAHSSYGADDVAAHILAAIKSKRFMILSDRQTKTQWRLSRWLPNFFFRQKLKLTKRMNP